MQHIYECLIQQHGMAFATGTVIFLLTIFLVSKRVIGFIFSIIFMLIALGATLAVEHQNVVKAYFNKWVPTSAPSTKTEETAPAAPSTTEEKPAESTHGQVQDQKERLKGFLEGQ